MGRGCQRRRVRGRRREEEQDEGDEREGRNRDERINVEGHETRRGCENEV